MNEMDPRPEGAQSLVNDTDNFTTHASFISKLVSKGGNKDDLKWLYEHGADDLRRSHHAFRHSLQAVEAALLDKSKDDTVSQIQDLQISKTTSSKPRSYDWNIEMALKKMRMTG